MSEGVDISVDFAGLKLANPVFTASGTCGYADELGEFADVNGLGGFITKSITAEPRKGNSTPRVVETDSGLLNAIGLANIGVENFIEQKMPILEKMRPAVFVNVAGESVPEYVNVVQQLAEQGGIDGFELNISCPNVAMGGMNFGTEPEQVQRVTSAVKKAAGDKLLMVKLTPNVTDIAVIAQAAVDGGADALSLVNTFTGMVIDIERRVPVLANGTGGLSGPAVRPMAVYLVSRVYTEVTRDSEIPILGLGGIRTTADALEFLIAGASAVAVGTATFIEPACSLRIIEGLKDYCRQHQFSSTKQLTGSLLRDV